MRRALAPSRSRAVAVARALLLCVCAAARLRAQCPDGTPPPCARAQARAVAPPANSVAVLYFDNASHDSADAYLADGLTEELISRLSDIERLTVRSRHVVRRYRGTALGDPAAVARALNVAYLVTGSVRRSGGRVRVNAELIRAAGAAQVWGQPFDQTGGDVLSIQEIVARQIATGIVGRLLPAEAGRIAARPTRDPVAWDHFLRGNYLLALRSQSAYLNAVREYEAALAADSRFTDALARIAYTYATIVDNEVDVGLSRDTLLARGLTTASRAIAMDSGNAEAWLALAYVREGLHPRTLDGAGDAFRRAIALDPRLAEAHHQYADYFERIGDTASARSENLRALAIEPGRVITYLQLLNQAGHAGRIDEALALSDSALAVDPRSFVVHLWRFMYYTLRDDTTGVRLTIAAVARDSTAPGMVRFWRDYSTVAKGDTATAELMVHAILGASQPPTVPGTQYLSGYFALLIDRLGDHSGALQLLEQAQPRGAILHWIMTGKAFDSLRGDPRFQRILRESAPGVTP